MAAFDKALKISAIPLVWNDIAYQLTLKSSHLDLARRYAESAVSGTSARLRNVTARQLKQRDLGLVSSLGSYWDTLGWVAFSEGKLDLAEKYVSAAWQLGKRGEKAIIWDRFTKNKARKKKPNICMPWRSFRAARNRDAEPPGCPSRREDKVDAVVEKYRKDLQQQRTIRLSNTSKLDGNADFFILQSAGPAPQPYSKMWHL